MKIEIKHRFTRAVILSREADNSTVKLTVDASVSSCVSLPFANLSKANLSFADLSEANLSKANLSKANLSKANLSKADLSKANLSKADLSFADLSKADLSKANLSKANLSFANLSFADLSGADLSEADLSEADLSKANLSKANLSKANLSESDTARLMVCPDTGAFDGWKKCEGEILVRVRIPESARRSSATGRKCRAECVDVIEVVGATEATSAYDSKTKYKVGERVTCDAWGENRWKECDGGIHFFITRAEAEAY